MIERDMGKRSYQVQHDVQKLKGLVVLTGDEEIEVIVNGSYDRG